MSNIKVSYTGDGVTVLYTIPFQYLNRDHVKVSVNGSGTSAFTFANDTTIQFNTAPANGADIVLERETTADAAENTFFPNSSIRSSALNDNFLQTLYVSEEAREIAADAQLGNIVPGSIGTAILADGAVTNAKVSNTADIAPSKIAGTAVITTDARLSDERIPTDGSVTNAKVSNSAAIAYSKLDLTGSLVDADVNASAAIAGTKISPDFGSQNVVTTGEVQAQDVVASGDVQTGSINGGPLAGFRNAIINGNFDIWQRGTSFTGSDYGADRWAHGRVGTTHTVTRQPFTLGQTEVPGEPQYFCRTVVSSVAGAGNNSTLNQPIEDVRTFAGQQVTVSFWAKADASKPIAVEFSQNFGTGGSPSAGVTSIGATKVTLSTSWQKITVTASIPSISGKTLGSDNNSLFRLVIWFDAGSNWNGRTDSLGQQSGTFDIAQVQVEAGPVATPFERRPIGVELALCQRYCWVLEASGNNRSFGVSTAATATNARNPIVFPVPMRTLPSFTASADAVSLLYGVTTYVSTSTGLAAASPYGGHILTNVASGLASRESGLAQVANGKSLTFDAEL